MRIAEEHLNSKVEVEEMLKKELLVKDLLETLESSNKWKFKYRFNSLVFVLGRWSKFSIYSNTILYSKNPFNGSKDLDIPVPLAQELYNKLMVKYNLKDKQELELNKIISKARKLV